MTRAKDLPKVYKNFKPTPLMMKEEFDAFYVPRPIKTKLVEELALKIKVGEKEKYLFMGHRGSGKSTELYQIPQLLGENQFCIIQYSVKDALDLNDININDFLLSLALKIYECGQENKLVFSKDFESEFMDFIGEVTRIEEREKKKVLEAGISLIKVLMAKIKSESQTRELIRRELGQKVSQLMMKINDLIALLESELRKKLVIIIDDLDKLTRYEQSEVFFYKNYQLLTQPNCIIVYTFPIPLAFNPYFENVRHVFNGDYILPQPAVKTRNLKKNDPTGMNFYKNIAYKRMKKNLIDEEVLEYAIISTGKLAEFIRLIREAAIKAYGNGEDKITKPEIEEVLTDLRAVYERTLTEAHIKKLLEIWTKKEARDDDLNIYIGRDLLFSLTAVEYENSKKQRWQDINPILLPLIKKWEQKKTKKIS